MPRSVSMIGLSPDELPWVRHLVALLRHPDSTVVELTRQALLYLANGTAAPRSTDPNPGKNCVMLNCRK